MFRVRIAVGIPALFIRHVTILRAIKGFGQAGIRERWGIACISLFGVQPGWMRCVKVNTDMSGLESESPDELMAKSDIGDAEV